MHQIRYGRSRIALEYIVIILSLLLLLALFMCSFIIYRIFINIIFYIAAAHDYILFYTFFN